MPFHSLTFSEVALVDPKMLDPGKLIIGTVQQQGHARAILNVCRMDLGSKDKATGIDQDVPFATIDTFGTVVASYAANTSRANRLAVDNRRARLRVAADAYSELLTQDSVEVLPRAVHAPQPEIVISGLPGWEFVREQPPGTAAPHDVEDGVQDLADRVKPRSADGLGRRKQRVETSEFSVRQVGQIGSPRGQTPAILPAKPTRVPVFRQSLVSMRGDSSSPGGQVLAPPASFGLTAASETHRSARPEVTLTPMHRAVSSASMAELLEDGHGVAE